MSNKKYTNYSKQNKRKSNNPITEEVSEEKNQNIHELNSVVNETSKVINSEIPETLTGTVVNCIKLNIREEASKSADILCAINKGEEVEIVEEESTDDFYSAIYRKDKLVSVYGFCMKDYIQINK